MSRRWDRKPETEQDKKFYNQLDKLNSLPPDTDDGTVLAEWQKLDGLVKTD